MHARSGSYGSRSPVRNVLHTIMHKADSEEAHKKHGDLCASRENFPYELKAILGRSSLKGVGFLRGVPIHVYFDPRLLHHCGRWHARGHGFRVD